jgi:outer membrane protein TolC
MSRTPLILMLLFIAAAAGLAQKRTALTLDQGVALGLENSRALHASRMGADAADAKSSEASAAQFPSLKAAASYTRLSDVPPFTVSLPNIPGSFTLSPTVVNNYNMRLTLQQPLFTGFRVQSGASLADNAAKAAGQDYHRDRAELVYGVTSAYWNLYRAIEVKKLTDETAAQVKAHLQDVRNFQAAGLATNNEVLKVQVQYSSIQLQQIDAANNVQLAMIGLDNVMGIPLDTQVELLSAPERPDAAAADSTLRSGSLPDLSILSEQALERRPEVRAIDFRVKAGEDAVSMARSGWFPQVYLTGNYNYARPNSRIVPTQDIFKDTWDVSLTASWDLWNWGTTIHQTHQAQAQLAQAEDYRSQLRDGVRLEVTQAYLFLKQAGDRIGVSEQGVEQATENYRVTKEKFASGLALNSELLDAEVALLQAKMSLTQSLVDYQLSAARLRKAIGQ